MVKLSYQDFDASLNNMNTNLLSGKNTDGENVILQRLSRDCILLITCQDNGWLRKNYYYEDGSTEETYER